MKKSGRNYTFSEDELKTLLSNVTRSGIRDFSGNIGEIALEIMGFAEDEIDDLEETEEDIDNLISRILTKPAERVKLRRQFDTGTYRGCGLGSGGGGCGR